MFKNSMAILIVALFSIGQNSLLIGQVANGQPDLKRIMGAINAYKDKNAGRYPAAYSTGPNGEPLLSWRVHVLPFLGEKELYGKFNLSEPWNSATNKKLIPLMPKPFQSTNKFVKESETTVRGFGGFSGCFSRYSLKPNRVAGRKAVSVFDGLPTTIFLVEMSGKQSVVWTKPEELDAEAIEFEEFLSSKKGIRVAFCDGRVSLVPEDVYEELFRGKLTISGNEPTFPKDFKTQQKQIEAKLEIVEDSIERLKFQLDYYGDLVKNYDEIEVIRNPELKKRALKKTDGFLANTRKRLIALKKEKAKLETAIKN